MMPAMMKAATKPRMPPPMLATMPSAALASSPSFGWWVLTSAGRSSCASCQAAWTFGPTTGHAATPGLGGGICSVFCCTPSITRCTESPIELSSTAVGATISATPSTVISVAAQPVRAPILAASHWCSGYSVTARISAQTISTRKGENTR